MNKFKKMTISLILTLVMLMTSVSTSYATVTNSSLDEVINDCASYIYKTVSEPRVSTIGGEWAIIGLSRSDYSLPNHYYDNYYNKVESHVKAKKGILHDKRYTEYSRVILALTSIGKDPTNVAGYNLITPLGDYEKTTWQGLNGAIWALIALDSGDYDIPGNLTSNTQTTRQMYVDYIIQQQQPDGGWSLLQDTDPDLTGMALQALSKYKSFPNVKEAIDKSLSHMSEIQNSKGGYTSDGNQYCESAAQMITALGELGIALDDPKFVKEGNTMLDNLMSFYRPGNGFAHTSSAKDTSHIASEQGLYALVAAKRLIEGKNSLYRMSDVEISKETDTSSPSDSIPGRHKDIVSVKVVDSTANFNDISNHKNKEAIKSLASRKIINGKSKGVFAPNDTVTRAEFATIIINSLGLKTVSNTKFHDIDKNVWYAPYVGGASHYGIVGGISDTLFNPNGTITKQEAAAMITRAAGLTGTNTLMDEIATRNTLAPFSDYILSAPWARPSLAFCYNNNLLDTSELEIKAATPITRGEVAQLVANLLELSNLL